MNTQKINEEYVSSNKKREELVYFQIIKEFLQDMKNANSELYVPK